MMGVLNIVDAMRMMAEMTILFELREPCEPPPEDWPKEIEHWQPFANSTLNVPWHRRLNADSGALVLPFIDWGKEPALWYAVLYKSGRIIETQEVPCERQHRSPAEAMFWADCRLGRPTMWERLR
jgi:hypothetical protein